MTTQNNVITIVKANDTDFNGVNFLTVNLTSENLNIDNFKAVFTLGYIRKEISDIEDGTFLINLTAADTKNLPTGLMNGALHIVDEQGRITTVCTTIPFKIIDYVNGNAVATEPYTLNFDVKQEGETIFTVNIETGVSVKVAGTETLPAGSDAEVENVGTLNFLKLLFKIPKGDKGEQGIQGEPGAAGNGIANIQKTSTSGLIDTYTITYENGNTDTYTVTNGAKGEKGDTGAGMRVIVVSDLPASGETGTIYLIPKTTADQQDIYDEYIWAVVSSNPETYDWEHIGNTNIDLTNYATEEWVRNQNYLKTVSNEDVINALGYTPYNATNPNKYTSVIESTVHAWGFTKNAGTVTSVNDVKPVNGNVTLSIPDANVQYISGGGSEDVDLSELYIDSQGATYSFYYDYDYGTIRNNNQQTDESFAYAMIEIYLENDSDITISFRQSSEQNCDFGEISELDQCLMQDQYEDTDYVAWSGKGYSDIEDSITFSNVMAGYHFFTVKYLKDSSAETGDDTFEITAITIGSGSGSSGGLIDTGTQEEIPLSQINDMPSVLQNIRDSIPDTSNFVTMGTKQMITAPKAITGTDTPWGTDPVQKNLFMAVSNSNTTSAVEWIGRSMFGANNLTFLIGTINGMAALGAHSWTSAKQGTGAAWADIYINPDGDKAVKIGGSPMVGRSSIMIIQNAGQTYTGTVKINRSARLDTSPNYKDAACWGDDVLKFNFASISGYNSSVQQVLQHDTSGNLKWVNV